MDASQIRDGPLNLWGRVGFLKYFFAIFMWKHLLNTVEMHCLFSCSNLSLHVRRTGSMRLPDEKLDANKAQQNRKQTTAEKTEATVLTDYVEHYRNEICAVYYKCQLTIHQCAQLRMTRVLPKAIWACQASPPTLCSPKHFCFHQHTGEGLKKTSPELSTLHCHGFALMLNSPHCLAFMLRRPRWRMATGKAYVTVKKKTTW